MQLHFGKTTMPHDFISTKSFCWYVVFYLDFLFFIHKFVHMIDPWQQLSLNAEEVKRDLKCRTPFVYLINILSKPQ